MNTSHVLAIGFVVPDRCLLSPRTRFTATSGIFVAATRWQLSRRSKIATTFVLAIVLATSSLVTVGHATIVFNGFANALPGVGGSFVGADWSSDLGPDYRAFP